ncbi:MAG: ATP-binding protein [Leptolyngbyaceae cyanobacterium bins.349]|nr:ATP-binding protein [Leptolyngbyaceae cyanobacterium bins.349]
MSHLLSRRNSPKHLRLDVPDQSVKQFIRQSLNFNQLGIGQKIAYGYALAIGIASLGATLGVIIGDYFQLQAQQKSEIAHDQEDLLNRLDKQVIAVRSHPQRLVSVLGDSIWFDFEQNRVLGNISEVKAIQAELDAFVQQYPTSLATSDREYLTLIQGYTDNIETYAKWTSVIWKTLDPGNLKRDEIKTAQQQILNSLRSEIAIAIEVKFEHLSEQLNRIIHNAQMQQEQATAQLVAAKSLRLNIIVVSLLLSGSTAATLAWFTSRAIARPIEAVTQVAQQVTQEANFTLKAPVTTQDEIGVMARSFNSLVQKVAEDTQALELEQAMLENRVQERTQELQQTLDNLRKAQSQLIQAEKMSSLGQLVAGVAHEINNPVNFIHGNLTHATAYSQDLLALLQLYQTQYPQPTPLIAQTIDAIDLDFLVEDMPKLFDSMQVGADRIREIVQSLRSFSRLDEAEVKDVDVHEGLDSTLMILQNRLKARPNHPAIEVVKHYGNLPKVECYAGQLNQVFMNILANAIDVLEDLYSERSPLTPSEPPQITIHTAVIGTNRVAIQIADNGPGMAKEVHQRLFDPFFTTKPVGKGTGMGMSISYQIVTERHNGTLYCVSEPGQGATFVVEIPILQNVQA